MEATKPVSAGEILGRTNSALLANLVAFVVLGLVLFTPVFVVSLIVGGGEPGHSHHVGAAEVAKAEGSQLGSQIVVGMLAFLALYVLAGAVAYGTLEHLDGRKVGAIECVTRGVRRMVQGADTAFVVGILVGVGFLLFVVPGVVLGCLLFVAVPAAVVEQRSVFLAMAHSRDLTGGNRMRLLTVFMASLVPLVLAGVFLPDLLAPLGRTLAILVTAHVQVLFALLGAISQTVAYHLLGGRASDQTA